jgi:Cof subfamily protein (haloacid dehalogenase superfamily)
MHLSDLPYRLCALDLDETLLNPEHTLTDRNSRAVRAVVEKGVVVVLASGRMHESALPFHRQLDLNTPIISYNGAMVKQPNTGELWLHENIPAERAQIVMDFCQERGLQLNFYLHDKLYTAAMTPWVQLYQSRTNCPLALEPELYTVMREKNPTKLIIVNTPEYTNELLPHFREIFGDSLYITKSTDEYLEFMPPTADKGKALAIVADRLGFTAAETIAFGDSYNDLPMIVWAGMGIAVANGKATLREAADRVIGYSADDAVAEALEEIFQL